MFSHVVFFFLHLLLFLLSLWWNVGPSVYIVHRERKSSHLYYFLCVLLVFVITVVKWYYVSHLALWRVSSTKVPDVVPPFFSSLLCIFLPDQVFAPGRWRRDVSCERTNEIPECSWAGRKSSRKTWQKSFLSVWWRSWRKGGEGEPRWGIGRKRGKREEKWTHWIKIS